MHITVKCFASCREAVGHAELALDLPDPATVGDAVERLIETYPALLRFRHTWMIAVNKEYTNATTPLRDGDELACIPPVSGGARCFKSR